MKPRASTLNITLVQADLHWEDRQANLDMLSAMLSAPGEKMEVVVLPEMFSTGFSMHPQQLAEKMDGPTIQWMKKQSAARGIILTGSLIAEENGNFYNRLVWMLPNGEYGYYDKRHLFGYAGEDKAYTPGKKRLIASVKGWKLNLQICYDLRFPVWARQSLPVEPAAGEIAGPEYDILVYVANWPEKRSHAWKTLLPARAIENQCYVVGVNRTGIDGNGLPYSGDSMIVSPMGEIVTSAGAKAGLVTGQLQAAELDRVRTGLPFLKDADPFMIGNQ